MINSLPRLFVDVESIMNQAFELAKMHEIDKVPKLPKKLQIRLSMKNNHAKEKSDHKKNTGQSETFNIQ
jgi:hypothetical protein